MEEHFPIAIEYNDYVHQGTNIRDIRARVTTMYVKVASLGLDERSKEKLIRLAGKKYDEETDTITFITDRLVILLFCSYQFNFLDVILDNKIMTMLIIFLRLYMARARRKKLGKSYAIGRTI